VETQLKKQKSRVRLQRIKHLNQWECGDIMETRRNISRANKLLQSGSITLEGTDLECHLDEILIGAHRREGDILLFTSSLPEGIGTPTSDYDLVIICEKLYPIECFDASLYYFLVKQRTDGVQDFADFQPTQKPAGKNEYVSEAVRHYRGVGNQIDIEYWTLTEVTEAISSIGSYYDAFIENSVNTFMKFPERFSRIIHCLLVGLPLQNQAAYAELSSRIDKQKYLFVLYRTALFGFPEIKDFIGYYQAGRLSTCVHLIRLYMLEEFKALTHLLGNTNARSKWVIEFAINRMPTNHRAIGDMVMRAMQAETSSHSDQINCIGAVCEAVDAIQRECAALMDESSLYVRRAAVVKQIEEEFKQYQEPTNDCIWELIDRLRKYSHKPASLKEMLQGRPSRDKLLEALTVQLSA
jgi:hypothetical protein